MGETGERQKAGNEKWEVRKKSENLGRKVGSWETKVKRWERK